MTDATSRQDWMSVLAKAPAAALAEAYAALGAAPGFTWLRAPEHGAVMVRGRTGGTGAAFNLGEMTVTRCTLRLDDGAVGHAYVAGRNAEKARIAALCDAMLQGDGADVVRTGVVEPMRRALSEQASATAARAEQTRVDFFTMVRGE